MSHERHIPVSLQTDAVTSVKAALGDFWSSLFGDTDLVDALIAADVLSSAQLHVDVMEALSLRDHREMPVYHREHWHPLLIRLSTRNTGFGLRIGMPDTPIIGAQTSNDSDYTPGAAVYPAGEVFEVGRNADASRVYSYPFKALDGCDLVHVTTCACSSISNPAHLLLPGRDFSVDGGVFFIRKEQDPFSVDGYRVMQDGDDRVAVVWVCDAAFDTSHVGYFLAYPLGLDAKTTEASARMLSALWDVVTHGTTPRYLNAVIGAVFDVPVISEEATVESVSEPDADGDVTVVTSTDVYVIPSSRLGSWVKAGVRLPAGSFLTNDVTVHHGLSREEVAVKADAGEFGRLTLLPGYIRDVSVPVVLENTESAKQTGGWFQLNRGDTGSSPFWSSVRGRAGTTPEALGGLFDRLSGGGASVNPVKTLGYVALANAVYVRTSRPLASDGCAAAVIEAMSRLLPAGSSLYIVQDVGVSDAMDVASDVVTSTFTSSLPATDSMSAASDSVSFTFHPLVITEIS